MQPCEFGTEAFPLRPSSLGKLAKCSPGVLLTMLEDAADEGGKGAQTGTLVHRAAQQYHTVLMGGGDATLAELEGLQSLDAAAPEFPLGDRGKAQAWFKKYAADPANATARVKFLESGVAMTYRGVSIRGTLDQVREDEEGRLRVWDIKTGVSLEADACVDEYQFQQAGYVLAARESLHPDVLPGGLIFAAGYDTLRGRRHLPMQIELEDCYELMDAVVEEVLLIRRGLRPFKPSAATCGYCPHRRFPKCKRKLKGIVG